MAKVIKNLLVQGLSGKLGDQFVIRRLRDGRTILCAKPNFSRRKLSPKQKNHHQWIKEAAAYAGPASHREPIYAQLAEGTMLNAYNVAVRDWFHPPVIHRVDLRQGEAVRIQTSDDVMVTHVLVTILDEKGKVMEKGEATKGRGNWWEYMPTAEGKVVVEVRDLAGNKVKAELESGG